MFLLALVRRALDGPVVTALAADAAGAPSTLMLDMSQCIYLLRNQLNSLIGVARSLIDINNRSLNSSGGAVPSPSAETFTDYTTSHVIDLAEVAGVAASKSGYRFVDIALKADYTFLLQKYGCSSPEALLQSGLSSAFRDHRRLIPNVIPAIRFGASGPLFFRNIDGSHRITAARAELVRVQRACLLSIDVQSVEPRASVVQLLEQWDVVAATMAPAAVTELFGRSDIRKTASMIAKVYGSDVLAVVRRGTRAAKTVDALMRAGRMFGLRYFLTQCGCRLAS